MSRLLSFITPAAVIIVSISFVAVADRQPVRFAVLGDRTGEAQPGIYEGIVAEIIAQQPDFVMNVGDMIEDIPDDSALIIERWNEYNAIVGQFTVSYHRAPGNNDIWNDRSAQLYREFSGEPYYSVDDHGIHLVILDNSRYNHTGDFTPEELAWLSEDLSSQEPNKPIAIFMHKPFWYNTTAEGSPDSLHALFVKYGVDAVFTGHYHEYFYGTYDNIKYVGIGSSGGDTRVAPNGLLYHFAMVSVVGEKFDITVVSGDKTYPANTITVAERKIYQSIQNSGLSFGRALRVEPDLTVGEQAIQIDIDNEVSPRAMDGVIEWTVPENWTVAPETLQVNIPAGQHGLFDFELSCSGPLYPLPYASTKIPYSAERETECSRYVAVARQSVCPRIYKAPTIDAVIKEPCWSKPASQFFLDDYSLTNDSTKVYLCHDDQFMYLAAECKMAESNELVANITERDGDVYTDEYIGFFFEPEFDAGYVYQIYFNSLGTIWDRKLIRQPDGYYDPDLSWNAEYELKTEVRDDRWLVEAKVPLHYFMNDQIGQKEWRVNFRRKRPTLGHDMVWQTPLNYIPDTFGKLTFE